MTPRQPRFHAEIPGRVRVGGVDYECVAHDLSRSGASLSGRFPGTPGATVGISLSPPSGGLAVELRGRIVRVSEGDGDDGRCLAVEFLDLEPGAKQALEMLLSRVKEHPPETGAGIASIRPGTSPNEIRKILQGVPLPDRIALAVRAKSVERAVLQHDIHPAVLDSLLRNPAISANEVAALLLSPTVSSAMLERVSRDPRWERDVGLRISIATHPRAPAPLAEQIVDGLPAQELRKVMSRPVVTPALRSKIIRRLAGG